jgi:hypothetical protein
MWLTPPTTMWFTPPTAMWLSAPTSSVARAPEAVIASIRPKRCGRGGAVTDPLSRYESVVDQQIRMAQERGEFDNLPGTGKPLPGRGRPDDELWWVKGYLRREGLSTESLLPTSLRLAKEIERLPETVRDLPSEQAVRERVGELNRRIAEYLRAPSGPAVRVGPVDADAVVARWRAERLPGAEPPAEGSAGRTGTGRMDAGEAAPRPPRRGGWLGRRFGRRGRERA